MLPRNIFCTVATLLAVLGTNSVMGAGAALPSKDMLASIQHGSAEVPTLLRRNIAPVASKHHDHKQDKDGDCDKDDEGDDDDEDEDEEDEEDDDEDENEDEHKEGHSDGHSEHSGHSDHGHGTGSGPTSTSAPGSGQTTYPGHGGEGPVHSGAGKVQGQAMLGLTSVVLVAYIF